MVKLSPNTRETEFWKKVYLANIRAGYAHGTAEAVADRAVESIRIRLEPAPQ